MSGMFARFARWMHRTVPKREEMEHNRFIRPFARRQELWRFTRRSVPRGVAIGLLVGILALIPGVQIVGAALLCVPFRGNIPLAAAMTFLTNPATTPLLLAASIFVGNRLGSRAADIATFRALFERDASWREWVSWLVSDAAPSILLGLSVIAVVTAAVGYLIASFGWRWWVGHKRRVKLDKLHALRHGHEPLP